MCGLHRPFLIFQVYEHLQTTIDSFRVPGGVGRIPRKLETGFSGLTADQYKNWVPIFSIPCLRGLIGTDDLECWRHFVLACFANGVSALVTSVSQMECSFSFVDELKECMEVLPSLQTCICTVI